MCHRFSGLSTYELNGHRKRDKHPTYVPMQGWHLYPTLHLMIHSRDIKTDSTSETKREINTQIQTDRETVR